MLKNITINPNELNDLFSIVENEIAIENIQNFDTQIEEINSSLVKEAVKHFSTKHYRSGNKDDFDERYFYHKEEVDLFFKLNKNPKVKVRIEYEEKQPNQIYCYILYR